MVLVFHQQETGNVVKNHAGCRWRRRGGGGTVCVCELFMGHIGYISLKTKNIFFFIIEVFSQKLETSKKKKKEVFSSVHSEAEMCSCFSASCRLLPPSGLILGPRVGKLYPGGPLWTSNLKVAPANI